MAENRESIEENGLNGQFLTADAVHPSLKGSLVTCMHCEQQLNEDGLINHHLFGPRERHSEEIFKKMHKQCNICTGWVYPILNNEKKIKFFHKCQVSYFIKPNKYVCAACEREFKSKRAFIQHTNDGCKKMCLQCSNLMFTKRSEYGVEVDHVCNTDFGGSTSTICSDAI